MNIASIQIGCESFEARLALLQALKSDCHCQSVRAGSIANGLSVPQPTLKINFLVASDQDAEIARLVREIRQTVDEMEALEETVRTNKDRLRTLLVQRGESWRDDDGYARLTSDSVRSSYDTKALDELIVSDPVRNGWLSSYRKEFAVRGSVQVK